MEKRVDSLAFRRMTHADFRHINKVGGEEKRGGGQSYIDFPTKEIGLQAWHVFLGEPTSLETGNRPAWEFTINSLGCHSSQRLKVYQRRKASVSIGSQKIHSRASNRVYAWHPDNGFPEDYDPARQNLIVYMVKTTDQQYWAGWFLESNLPEGWYSNISLDEMFSESAGYIEFRKPVFIDTENSQWPFYPEAKQLVNEIPTEEDIDTNFELEDTSAELQALIDRGENDEMIARLMKIRRRNKTLVKTLKTLYKGRC